MSKAVQRELARRRGGPVPPGSPSGDMLRELATLLGKVRTGSDVHPDAVDFETARTVLELIRAATDAMIEAGFCASAESDGAIRAIFEAMIDAELRTQ